MTTSNVLVVLYELPTHDRVWHATLWTTAEPPSQPETNPHFIGRHVPRAHTIQTHLRMEDYQRDQVRDADLWNPHFIGRYVPRTHSILPVYRQEDEARDIQRDAGSANVRVVAYSVPRPSLVRTSFIYYEQPATDVPSVAQAETNTHFIGRFNATVHSSRALFSALYTSGEALDVQSETNPHFLGRFVPTQHRLLAALRQQTDTVSTDAFIAETQPHFLGHYVPAQYPPRALVFSLYFSPEIGDTPVVTQVETNPHFLGKFTPTTYQILAQLRWGTASGDVQTGDGVDIRVVGYKVPRPSLVRSSLIYYQRPATDVPVVTVDEAAVSFLGRFKATQHAIIATLRQNPDTTAPGAFTAEAQPHFLGRFSAVTYQINPALRQNITSDFTETNPHFLGKFTAPKHSLLPLLRQVPALDVFVEQAGRDWIGRFRAQVHTIQTALRQTPNTDFRIAGEASTEPHFIGRHTPAAFRRFPYNSFDTAVPVAASDIPNPHFLGKHAPRTHTINPHLRMTDYQRDFVIDQPNINFLGRFKAQIFAIQAALRQNSATDVQVVVQAETNVHFLGRHVPASHRINPALRHARALDNAPEVQPHFLGRFKAPVLARFAYNTWDTRVPVADRDIANPHFLGRYTVTKHRFLVGWRQNDARDVQPETNVSFIGRHAPRQHVVLPGFRQNIPLDIFITPETQPHFLGHFTPTAFDLLPLLRMNPDVAQFVPTTPGWVFPTVDAASIVPLVEMAHGVMPSVSRLGNVVSSHSPNPIWRD